MNPTSDPNDPNSVPPLGTDPGQPTDWEARFKGQQTAFNKQALVLKAKEDALAQAIAERDQLKSGNNQALIDAQALIAQRQNELNAAQTAKQTLEQQLALKDKELGALQTVQQARAKLTALKATDLLPALDTGVLTFDSLEDAAMQDKITKTRAWLATLGIGNPPAPEAPNFSGSGVPSVTPSNQGAPNASELFVWLNDPRNMNHPDYEKLSDSYYKSLSVK